MSIKVGDKVKTRRSLYLHQNKIENQEGEIVEIEDNALTDIWYKVALKIEGSEEPYIARLLYGEFEVINVSGR